jgi:cytochrome c
MDNRTNTIAGWMLGAGIIALGASIVSGEMFHAEPVKEGGYPIEGVEEEGAAGAEAEQPIAAFLATANVAKGEQVFKKCAACHTVNQGGANGLGPNLWGVVGGAIGKHAPGFPYSPDLAAKGGTWGWEELNQWLKSPKAFVPGTKMTFAGLGKVEDRANLIAYMNAQGSNLPMPAAPEAAANPAQAAAEAADAGAAGDKGESEPVLNETQAIKGAGSSLKGEGAPTTSGNSEQQKAGQH